MMPLRLIVPAILAAAAAAGCFTYFVTPAADVETDRGLPQTVQSLRGRADTAAVPSKTIGQHQSAEEKSAEAYRRAAEAILRRVPNARASVGADEPRIPGRSRCQKRAHSPALDAKAGAPRLCCTAYLFSAGLVSFCYPRTARGGRK